jgi:hypothetical protein
MKSSISVLQGHAAIALESLWHRVAAAMKPPATRETLQAAASELEDK